MNNDTVNEFTRNGLTYVAKEVTDEVQTYCDGCSFVGKLIQCSSSPPCMAETRTDNRHIIWVQQAT